MKLTYYIVNNCWMVTTQQVMPLTARDEHAASQKRAEEAIQRVEELRKKAKRTDFIYGISFVVAGFGALAASVMQIWSQHYSEYKNRGTYFQDLRTMRHKAHDIAVDKLKNGSVSFADHLGELQSIDKNYSQKFKEGLKKLGYEIELPAAIKGTWQRWRAIGPIDRSRVALTGLVTTAVTIGALFTIKSNQRAKVNNELYLAELEHKEALSEHKQAVKKVLQTENAPEATKGAGPNTTASLSSSDHQGTITDSSLQSREADGSRALA